jgi:hypothetical protein
MKKMLLACSLILLAPFTYGQFNFPSEPEHIFPPANLDVGEASEIACTSIEQGYGGLGTQALFAYSWSNQSHSYLAWRRADPNSNTTFDEGYLSLPSYRSIDVGIYKHDDDDAPAFVIIAYYDENNPGHFYRIYEFTPTGLSPIGGPQQLSSSPTFGRISLDVHRTIELGIVWEDNSTNSLRVSYGHFTNGNTFVVDPPRQINNTANATFPHMAVCCAPGGSGTGIKVVYYDQVNSNIRVISSSFSNIISASGTVNFGTEDVAPPMYPTFDPHTLRIDCPEHYTEDNWSYVYHGYGSAFTQEYIACRVNTNTFYNSYELSGGLFGGNFPLYNILLNPTLTYSNDGNSIYYGWHYGDNNIGNPNTTNPGASGWRVVVNLREDGVPFEQNYQCVTDPLLLGVDYLADSHYPPVAFSRKAIDNSNMFIAYPVFNPTNGDHHIATKLIPWGQNHFRPENNTDIHKQETSKTALHITPNPFTSNFNISSVAGNKKEQYQATLSNISGTVIYKKTGNLDEINKSAAPYLEKLPAGIYLLNINSTNNKQTFKMVKIR